MFMLLCSCCHGYIGLSQETKDKYWNSVAQQLAEGLADNWSQVHLYCLFLLPNCLFIYLVISLSPLSPSYTLIPTTYFLTLLSCSRYVCLLQ